MTRDRWRRGLSHLIVALCAAAVLAALVPLAFVLFYVAVSYTHLTLPTTPYV